MDKVREIYEETKKESMLFYGTIEKFINLDFPHEKLHKYMKCFYDSIFEMNDSN
jgi:hypothetical protein